MTLGLATIGRHTLTIPGRHEAEALTDACPDTECFTYSTPAAVLDVHGKGRVAAYRCPKCSAGWLCWWSLPTGRQPHRLHQAGRGRYTPVGSVESVETEDSGTGGFNTPNTPNTPSRDLPAEPGQTTHATCDPGCQEGTADTP